MDNNPNSEILTASEYTVKAAKKELDKTLDYSMYTFQNLEALIQHIKARFTSLKNEGKLSDKTIQSTSISIGSYLGEVIRRHHGGTWIARNPVMKTLVIDGKEFSPILYIFQRLAKDSDFSLDKYWSEINRKLYSPRFIEDKLQDKPPVLETPKKTANNPSINQKLQPQNSPEGNLRVLEAPKKTSLITVVMISIPILCIIGILGLSIYSTVAKILPTKAPTPNWRLSPFYVSEKQFGEDWPFTVSEGLIECVGQGIVLHINGGTYGLTGYTNTLGYTNIKESGLWRTTDSPLGEVQVSLSPFTSYAVDKCQ